MKGLQGCLVTGTDTEVGKTLVSSTLVHWLTTQGLRAAGYKPVASGMEQATDGRWYNDDVMRLHAAGSADIPPGLIGPFQFRVACAPHIAAALEQRPIDRMALVSGGHVLGGLVDRLVIEGAGGLRVPLGEDWDSADLMVDFDLPVVLVVGMRLGCFNHALLTADVLAQRGLRLAGWVANSVHADMPYLEENFQTLQACLEREHQTPCLGRSPSLGQAGPAAAVEHLDAARLRRVFALDSGDCSE